MFIILCFDIVGRVRVYNILLLLSTIWSSFRRFMGFRERVTTVELFFGLDTFLSSNGIRIFPNLRRVPKIGPCYYVTAFYGEFKRTNNAYGLALVGNVPNSILQFVFELSASLTINNSYGLVVFDFRTGLFFFLFNISRTVTETFNTSVD